MYIMECTPRTLTIFLERANKAMTRAPICNKEVTPKIQPIPTVPKKRFRNEKHNGDCEISVSEISQSEASMTERTATLSTSSIISDSDVPIHMQLLIMYSKERHATVSALDGMIKCL